MVPHCLVSLIEEAQVPAQEPGVLTELHFREGQAAKAGAILGKIDDIQPQMARNIASFEHQAASEKATNDIDIRYAAAAAKVAEFEYRKNVEAAKRVPGSVSEVELQRLKLQWDRAVLQIEQAQKEQKLSAYTASAKKAEVDNAEEAIRRREIRSPIDGVVQRVYPHLGEWVKPGDPAFHVLRMDRLRVEGFLNKDEFGPEEVTDQPVMVQAELARGRKVQFPGKIVFVSPVVEAGGEYRVWAEVENRQENNLWLLRPGLQATMAIQLR